MRAIKTADLTEFNDIALRIHNALKKPAEEGGLEGYTEQKGFLRWSYPDYISNLTGEILLIVEEDGDRGDIIMNVLTQAEKDRIVTVHSDNKEYFSNETQA